MRIARRLAVSGVLLAIVMPMAMGASPAQARDALTEEATTQTLTRFGADFSERNKRGCRQRSDGTTLTIACAEGGYATYVYSFAVPAKAINLRPRSTASDDVGAEGYRNGAKQYDVHLGVYGEGTYVIEDARVRFDIPTAFDRRPCVTPGEWARVNVWLGGIGGTLKSIASVFETNGKRLFLSQPYDGFRFEIRGYKRCGSTKTRKITFHHYPGRQPYSYWG